MKRTLLASVALFSLVTVSAQSNADTMKLTFNGTVIPQDTSGNYLNFDATNTFGLGTNVSLAGQAVSISFLYNANPGDVYLLNQVPPPIYSMSVSINGKTFTTTSGVDGAGDFGSTFLRNDGPVLSGNADVVYSTSVSGFNRTGMGATIFNLPSVYFSKDLVTPFDVTNFLCGACGSFIGLRSLPTSTDYFMGTFDVTSASLSAVPVPATLPLFGTGLAALGYAGRKRKAKVAA